MDGRVAPWGAVKSAIPQFIDALRIKVVNSDEALGESLDFAERASSSGRKKPKDLFTIVIGGSVLSRGLTLEGLATSYFTRWSTTPTEDTVLQLSRWFGYRGSFLEFCRIFTTSSIYRELQRMNTNDRDLRTQLASLMTNGSSPREAAIAIQSNPRALPTAKLGEGRRFTVSYAGMETVFRDVEVVDARLSAKNEAHALAIVEEVERRSPEDVVSATGSRRGCVSYGWLARDIAALLDAFSFSTHNPSPEGNPLQSYYRQADPERQRCASRDLSSDPYQVAAYLRKWEAEHDGCPTFNVAIAFGELNDGTAPFTFPLVNREVMPSGEVVGGWGGRSTTWRGDQFFDGVDVSFTYAGTSRRRPGAPGLLLLYVVHRDAIGRKGRGITRALHTPFCSMVIPEGGPVITGVAIDRRRVIIS